MNIILFPDIREEKDRFGVLYPSLNMDIYSKHGDAGNYEFGSKNNFDKQTKDDIIVLEYND